MSLKNYFTNLINKVENSEGISNAGKDGGGFYKPTRTIVLRHLNLLHDLHDKPLAREMIQSSWAIIVKELPPEWLILNDTDKQHLKNVLK